MFDNVAQRKQQQAECEAGTRQKKPVPAYKCKDRAGCDAVIWEAGPGIPQSLADMGDRIVADGRDADGHYDHDQHAMDDLPF